MASIHTLRAQAARATHWRRHRMRWNTPERDWTHVRQLGTCIYCKAWVQLETHPAPNSINIGGPAVAENCTRTRP